MELNFNYKVEKEMVKEIVWPKKTPQEWLTKYKIRLI